MALSLIVFLGNMDIHIFEASDHSLFSQKQNKQDSEFLPSYLVKQGLNQMDMIRRKNELMNNVSQGGNNLSLDARLRTKQAFVEEPHYQASASSPTTLSTPPGTPGETLPVETEFVVDGQNFQAEETDNPEQVVSRNFDTLNYTLRMVGTEIADIPAFLALLKEAAQVQGYGDVADWSGFNTENVQIYNIESSPYTADDRFSLTIEMKDSQSHSNRWYADTKTISLLGNLINSDNPTFTFEGISNSMSWLSTSQTTSLSEPEEGRLTSRRYDITTNSAGAAGGNRDAWIQNIVDQAQLQGYGNLFDWQGVARDLPEIFAAESPNGGEGDWFWIEETRTLMFDDLQQGRRRRMLSGRIDETTGEVVFVENFIEQHSWGIFSPDELARIEIPVPVKSSVAQPDAASPKQEQPFQTSSESDSGSDNSSDVFADSSFSENDSSISPLGIDTSRPNPTSFLKLKTPQSPKFHAQGFSYNALEPIRILVNVLKNLYRPVPQSVDQEAGISKTINELFKAIEVLSDILNKILQLDFGLIQSFLESLQENQDEAQETFLLSIRPYYEYLSGSAMFQQLMAILGLAGPPKPPLDPEKVTEKELSWRDAVYEAYLMLTENEELLSKEETSGILRQLVRIEARLYQEHILPAQAKYEENVHQTVWELLAQIFNQVIQKDGVFINNQKDGATEMLINLVPVP